MPLSPPLSPDLSPSFGEECVRGGHVYGTLPRGWNVYSMYRQASGQKEKEVSSSQHSGAFADILIVQHP